MPAEYQVEQVIGTQDEWSNDFGRFLPYELKLSGPDAPNAGVVLNRKLKDGAVPDNKVPKQGQTLYLSITENAHGFRAKEEQRDSQGSSNGAQSDGPGEAYWEAKNRAIQRQAAHKSMTTIYELGRTEGVIEKANTKEEFFNRLKEIADWLDRDTDNARKTDDQIAF